MYMLKKICIICGLLLLASLPAFASTVTYSKVIEDLPLMLGMTENTDDAVVFDKPGGRIVEISAETSYSSAEIKKFYADSLSALGWAILSESSFSREGELLKITIEPKDSANLVHFNLKPYPEK